MQRQVLAERNGVESTVRRDYAAVTSVTGACTGNARRIMEATLKIEKKT
jgi:hypothetical protein